jgi:hypothetical protein
VSISMTWPQYRRCQCSASWQAEPVQLTASETIILLTLLLRPGWVDYDLVVEALYGHLPGGGPDGVKDCIHQFVFFINRKLGCRAIICGHTMGMRLDRDARGGKGERW